jgi:hypothetical protein
MDDQQSPLLMFTLCSLYKERNKLDRHKFEQYKFKKLLLPIRTVFQNHIYCSKRDLILLKYALSLGSCG